MPDNRFRVALSILLILTLAACASTVRRSSQVELFHIVDGSDKLVRPISGQMPASAKRSTAISNFGDLIRFPQDVVTIQVQLCQKVKAR